MSNQWIDVSVSLHTGMAHWPDNEPFERHMTLSKKDGAAANLSAISGSVHTGTHMDAPVHFLDGGAAIESMPLDAVIGRARVIEIKDPEMIRTSELEHYSIEKGERLLFKTRNSSYAWKTDEFQENFVYIAPDTAKYLAEKGVRTIGVDYLSVGGFKSGGAKTHEALLGAGVWVIEGLNLEHIQPGLYDLICLPLKIEGSDGAPARAVLRKHD